MLDQDKPDAKTIAEAYEILRSFRVGSEICGMDIFERQQISYARNVLRKAGLPQPDENPSEENL